MNESLNALIEAERKADLLFREVESRGLIVEGATEKQLNTEVYNLAYEIFGIRKYWHKRIVRAGKNTLLPYRENPPDLVLQSNDILFIDFGPVFEEWEADFGRTYVIGNDSDKLKLKQDVELAWNDGAEFYKNNSDTITGAELYRFSVELAGRYGWEYGNEHCGHLIGNFPHEEIQGEEILNYIHPLNNERMKNPDRHGNSRYWIYEIHFIDRKNQIGGFFEQLMG